MKFISSHDLPKAWELDQEWLERIGASEKESQHYLALDIEERRWMEASFKLLATYEQSGQLKSGRTSEGFLIYMAQELNSNWIQPKEDRVLNFRGALRCFEAYLRYQGWLESMPQPARYPLLDLVLPYWINRQDTELAELYLIKVQVLASGLLMGQLGHVKWDTIEFRLVESTITDGQFRKEWTPFNCSFDSACYQVLKDLPESREKMRFNLLFKNSFKSSGTWDEIRGTYPHGQKNKLFSSGKGSDLLFTLYQPEKEQIQKALDAIASQYNTFTSDGRIRLELEKDMLKIAVQTRF